MNTIKKTIPNEPSSKESSCDNSTSDHVTVGNEEPLGPSILAKVNFLLERCSEVLEELEKYDFDKLHFKIEPGSYLHHNDSPIIQDLTDDESIRPRNHHNEGYGAKGDIPARNKEPLCFYRCNPSSGGGSNMYRKQKSRFNETLHNAATERVETNKAITPLEIMSVNIGLIIDSYFWGMLKSTSE